MNRGFWTLDVIPLWEDISVHWCAAKSVVRRPSARTGSTICETWQDHLFALLAERPNDVNRLTTLRGER